MVKARNQNQVTSAEVSATPTTAVQAVIAEQLYDLQGRPAFSSDIAVKGMTGSSSPATYPNQIGFETGFIEDRNPADAQVPGDQSFWSTPGGTMEGDITSWVDQNVYSDQVNQEHAYSGRYYEQDPTSRTDITSAPGASFQANTPQAPRYAYGQYYTLPGADVGYSPPPISDDITNRLKGVLSEQIALSDPDNQSKNTYQTMVTRISLGTAQPTDSPPPALYQISMTEIAGGAGFNLSIDTNNNFLLSNTQYKVDSMLSKVVGNHIVRLVQHKFPNYYDSTKNIGADDKANFKTKTEIDTLGRATYSQGPDDNTDPNENFRGKRSYYNTGGLLRFSQDADQAAAGSCLYYVYDGMGRLIQVKGLTLTTWDATILKGYIDNPSSMPNTTDLRIYTYDAAANFSALPTSNSLGRLVRVDSWNCPDKLSSLDTASYNKSQVTEIYSYDNRGRLAQRQLGYYNTGSQVNADNFSYTYNNLSQVTQIAGSLDDDYMVNYQYNLQGLLSSVSDQNNNTYVQYVYNADGTLNSNVMSLTGYQTSYTYNTIKQLTDMLVIRSSDSSRTFDEILSYSKNGSYGDGNLTSAYSSYNNPIGAQNFVYNYTYDSFKRLASAVASPANNSISVMPSWNIVDTDTTEGTIKGYDSNGNIYNSSQASAQSQYNPGTNQLSLNNAYQNNNPNIENCSYTYTSSGRTQTKTINYNDNTPTLTLTFVYDILLGRPISIVGTQYNDGPLDEQSSPNTTIIYDAAGERIFKSTNNMTIQYYRHGPQVLYEQLSYNIDKPVNYIANYYYGLLGIVGGTYKMSGDTGLSTYNSIVDHLGSTRLIIDSDGSDITYFNYDTWGNLVGGNSSNGAGQESPALYTGLTRYLYTGQEWDAETQLYNYHARQYDPSSYRFLTPDPMYQYTNPYTYVANNPVNFVDPTGKENLRLDVNVYIIAPPHINDTIGGIEVYSAESAHIIRKQIKEAEVYYKEAFKTTFGDSFSINIRSETSIVGNTNRNYQDNVPWFRNQGGRENVFTEQGTGKRRLAEFQQTTVDENAIDIFMVPRTTDETLGFTMLKNSEAGPNGLRIRNTTIVLDKETLQGTSYIADIDKYTVTHELGHALTEKLDHSKKPQKLMQDRSVVQENRELFGTKMGFKSLNKIKTSSYIKRL